MLEKIEGFVIRTQDYGETNKIVTIFSGNLGKFAVVAKGAKKPKSRMAALTQPFIYAQFLVYPSKGLGSMQQGDVIDSYRKIREDIVKTAYAAYISELTDKMLENREPDFYIYDQFLRTMQWISEKDEDADIPVLIYELKMFKKAGFAPILDHCALCGRQEGLSAFSVAEGGLLCRNCFSDAEDAVVLPGKLPQLLGLFSRVGLEQIGNISMKRENVRLLRQLIDAYYDQYGGYFLKSRKFLNQLDLFR